MNTAKAVTARDIEAMLRRHYLPDGKIPAGFFAAEVGSPCGKRRADALWMPTTVSAGSGLVGHEIKVSRADLLVELGDPAKSDPWAQYCDRWWLVVSDPTFINDLQIPDAWGVMAPPSGRLTRSMTILRPAPRLSPLNPAPGLRKLIAWQLYGYGQRVEAAEHIAGHLRTQLAQMKTKLDEAQNVRLGATFSFHEQRVNEIVSKVDRGLREDNTWIDVDDDLVVAAIIDAATTRKCAQVTRTSLERVIKELETAFEPLRFARELAATAGKRGLTDLKEALS